MTCAKQRVICTITCFDGTEVAGENYCRRPQQVCPRDTHGYGAGEGYHLCQEVCRQAGHAEQVAVEKMGDRRGRSATLEGRAYACVPCKRALRSVGVRVLWIDGEVESIGEIK